MFDKKISESTVHGFKSVYQKEIKKMKRKLVETDSADSSDDLGVTELNPSKRGRKTLLDEKLDSKVQFFIKSVRDSGGVVNSAIVRAAAKGIVLSHERSLLFENGGHIELTKSWAKFLLKRMNMVKCKGTTSKTFVVENFTQEKDKYLKSIISKVEMYKIPPELVINWDQTGINIVPVSQWTMDVEGAKRVEITGIDDKRQITGKLFYNPKQLITLLFLNVCM